MGCVLRILEKKSWGQTAIYLKLYALIGYCALFEGLLKIAKVTKDTSVLTSSKHMGKESKDKCHKACLSGFS